MSLQQPCCVQSPTPTLPLHCSLKSQRSCLTPWTRVHPVPHHWWGSKTVQRITHPSFQAERRGCELDLLRIAAAVEWTESRTQLSKFEQQQEEQGCARGGKCTLCLCLSPRLPILTSVSNSVSDIASYSVCQQCHTSLCLWPCLPSLCCLLPCIIFSDAFHHLI